MSNELGEGYWFKSSLFRVELGEDKNTNPFCYGKQLSSWVSERFIDLGYSVEEVIEEDWLLRNVSKRALFTMDWMRKH